MRERTSANGALVLTFDGKAVLGSFAQKAASVIQSLAPEEQYVYSSASPNTCRSVRSGMETDIPKHIALLRSAELH